MATTLPPAPPRRFRRGLDRGGPRLPVTGGRALGDLRPTRGRLAWPSAHSEDVRRRYRLITTGLVLTDLACIVVALVVSHLLRFGWHDGPVPLGIPLAVFPLIWLGVFHAFALYRTPLHSPGEELRRIAGATSVGVVGGIVAGFWAKQDFSRAWLGLTWLLALVFEVGTREAWRGWVRRLKSDGRLALRTLIIGTNEEAVRIGHALQDGHLGYRPVGFVAQGELEPVDGLPVLGSVGALPLVIAEHRAECLFVASTAIRPDQVVAVAKIARLQGTEMVVSANLPEMLISRLTVQPLGDLMTISLRPVRLSGMQSALKRTLDLVLASALLLLTLPVWVLVGIAIRATSRGPVFFRQTRVTKGDRPFEMYKFRTMVVDAAQPEANGGLDTTAPFFKLDDDPRLTRVGRFLRTASLDELPQLLNVLRGEMSLVGPRPLPADQVAANQEPLSPRHEVRAGLTGWWQVNGRSDVKPDEAVRMDLFYIENWSLSLDLYILLKTVGVVLTARGAH